MEITLNLDPLLKGSTPSEFLWKWVKMILLGMWIFYYLYPAALELNLIVMTTSVIVPSGAIGIILYAKNKFPFKEVPRIIFFFFLILFVGYVAERLNFRNDGFRMMYLRSQMGWFFTAYLINFTLFNIHKNPKFEYLVGYMAAATIVQAIITTLMSQYPEVNDFFFSLMSKAVIDDAMKEMLDDVRLVGYGSYLFGGGMLAGCGLIFIAYLVVKLPLKKYQLLLFAIAYVLVFFIGIFTARTVIVGAVMSLILLVTLSFLCKDTHKKQLNFFLLFFITIFIIGASIAASSFPEYTAWAFELYYNITTQGKIATASSDALYDMFYYPTDSFSSILFGKGILSEQLIVDMGYTRLLFYFGFLGTPFFFIYMFAIFYTSITKDLAANIFILTIIVYVLVLNIKGFTDLNSQLYLFLFFFLFYKYYRYYPNLYLQGLLLKKEQLEKEEEKELTLKK